MPTPRAELVGRCVKEPRMGKDKNGKPYIFVRIACSDSHKDQNDQWVTDRELFVNVQWFGADTTMRIPQVGDPVRTFGRMYETVDEKDGKEYRNIVCDAEFIRSWEKKQSQQGWGDQPQGQQQGGWGGMVEQAQQNQQQGFANQPQAAQSNDPWNAAPPAPPQGDEPPF